MLSFSSVMAAKDLDFSVATAAYNEEKNIASFLKAVLSQELGMFSLKQIVIVASGCTDATISIIKSFQKKDKRIKLIIQKQREGKASAVNLLLKSVKTELVILQSADTIPAKSCYAYLLKRLQDPKVGLVAGKIVPKDDATKLVGFANHLKWELHHQVNLTYPERPKVGELIAFKKIFEKIPPDTSADEASIEPLIHLQDYKIVYVPRAIIYNKGPKKIREYLSRSRSNFAGHFSIKKKYSYEVVTLSSLRVVLVFIKNLKPNPKFIVFALATALLEATARMAGLLDVLFNRRDHSVWKIANSAKT